MVRRAKGLDARGAQSFRAILRRRRDWSMSASFQFRNHVAVHVRPFAIDRALQLQSRAMFRRKGCGNPLAVICRIVPPFGVVFRKREQFLRMLVQTNLLGQVPEKRASVSLNSDFAMLERGQERLRIRTRFNNTDMAQQARSLTGPHKLSGISVGANQAVLRLTNSPSRPAPVSRSVQGSGTVSPSSEKEALNGP